MSSPSYKWVLFACLGQSIDQLALHRIIWGWKKLMVNDPTDYDLL